MVWLRNAKQKKKKKTQKYFPSCMAYHSFHKTTRAEIVSKSIKQNAHTLVFNGGKIKLKRNKEKKKSKT